MNNFEIFEVETIHGMVYLRQEFVKQNTIKYPTEKLYDCFTNEECVFDYQYIAYVNKNKYLKYANIVVEEDETIAIEPINIKTISIEEFKNILISKREKGVDLYQETLNIIESGITRKEALNDIKQQTKIVNERKEKIEKEKSLNTFLKVFGDLFEDKIPTK